MVVVPAAGEEDDSIHQIIECPQFVTGASNAVVHLVLVLVHGHTHVHAQNRPLGTSNGFNHCFYIPGFDVSHFSSSSNSTDSHKSKDNRRRNGRAHSRSLTYSPPPSQKRNFCLINYFLESLTYIFQITICPPLILKWCIYH